MSAGHQDVEIAVDLGISQKRTVEAKNGRPGRSNRANNTAEGRVGLAGYNAQ